MAEPTADTGTAAAPAEAPGDSGRIAVVGMGIRVPGAGRDLDRFWEILASGKETTSFFSREELLDSGVPGELLDRPNFVPARAVVPDSARFDHRLFSYSPQDSALMDPQQRVLLECAWSALEHAGQPPVMPEGNRVGIYVGTGMNVYLLDHLWPDKRAVEAAGGLQMLISSDKDFAATRIGYKLNLHGPALTVQTACSTSLVAVHLAVQSLLTYESDLAMAGGATLVPPGRRGQLHEPGGIFSPDGRCRTFDAQGRGTVLGDGAGVVVLKRYEDAIRDRDTVHAVILGSAVNNDGSRKAGYTAPGPDGQFAVISEALGVAGVAADSIGYLEAHGTGTELGDPIEVGALTRVFGPARDDRARCALGSLKSVTGHMDTAAGVVGLIKTVLALGHRTIPPVAHFSTPNPALKLEDSVFHVPAVAEEWQPIGAVRRAGVSSFGIGGTNAHVVLEEGPPRPAPGRPRGAELMLVSARTPQAAAESLARVRAFVEDSDPRGYPDTAHTLRTGRAELPWRAAFVAGGRYPVPIPPREPVKSTAQARTRGVVLVVTGEGKEDGNQPNYDACRVYRRVADSGFAWLRAGAPGGELDGAARDRVKRFTAATGLIASLHSRGVRPAAALGTGVGALAAACAAGMFPLEEGFHLAAGLHRPRPAPRTSAHPVHVSSAATQLTVDQAADPGFWADVLARTGEDGTAGRLAELAPAAWLEIGTRVDTHLPSGTVPGEPEDPHSRLLFAVGVLWELGIGEPWDAIHSEGRGRVPAPTYPFADTRHFIDAPRG